MCGGDREGILCSSCRHGTLVFFHTFTHKCSKNTRLCSYGPLLYALSELASMTVLFVILICYNVSFTSRTAYSFVFFIQQLNVLSLYSKDSLNVNYQTYKSVIYIHWLYSLFNLQFFMEDSFSFCLWTTANAMDNKVISYVTVTYAIGLIFVLVFMANCCCVGCKSQSPLDHGLTTFLVLCYSQVTQVTFNLLEFQNLRGRGNFHYPHTVPYWDGEMIYFHGHHLYYAIPTLVFLFLIVIPTPLCLICDFLLLKLEGCLSVKSCYHLWTKIRECFKPLCSRVASKTSIVALPEYISYIAWQFYFLWWHPTDI